MILYWAWPPDGAGHAVRAAAICRHLRNDVLVVRGTNDPRINMALDYFDVPYVVHESKQEAHKFVASRAGDFLVWDDYPNTPSDRLVNLYIWRMNRSERIRGSAPMLRMEGPGSLWPILMLEDDEILSREDARDALGIPQDQFTIIGVTSSARPGVVEATDPDFMISPEGFWPALKYLRAADHLVGCPGANLYGEAAYLGISVTWIRAPHAPDQLVRLSGRSASAPQPGVARRFAEMIDDLHGQRHG